MRSLSHAWSISWYYYFLVPFRVSSDRIVCPSHNTMTSHWIQFPSLLSGSVQHSQVALWWNVSISLPAFKCCALSQDGYTRYATSLITEFQTRTPNLICCTVLCRVYYARSCWNLIGWFWVTTALSYTLGHIPVGLSISCVVNSLCWTMKWAGAHNLKSSGKNF